MSECVGPVPLSEEDLFDALDGSVSESLQNHLQNCIYCSERLEHLRKVEQRIQTLMYRSDCPSAEDLADFAIGIAEDDRRIIEHHLQNCVPCQEEVQKLQSMLQPDPIPSITQIIGEPIWRRFKNQLRNFDEQLVTLLAPQKLATTGQFRGREDRERILNYEHDSITVMFRLEKIMDGLKINGSILDDQSEGQWIGGYAELSTGEQKRFIAVIHDDENFIFEDIPQGLFQLNIYAVSSRILRLKDLDLTL